MLNKIILITILVSFFHTSLSQDNKQILASYLFINKNSNESYSIKTRIGKTQALSEFYSLSSRADTIIESNESVEIFVMNSDTTNKKFFISKDSITFIEHIYTNKKFVPVIVAEKKPQFNWQLTNNSQYVNGFLCNSAYLTFRGRNFNVWYAPEIPVQFGPWKFYGLPGLITKIETDDKTILFQLEKLSYVNEEEIKKPFLSKRISFQDYVKYLQSSLDDFLQKLMTQLPRGATMDIDKIELNGIEKRYD